MKLVLVALLGAAGALCRYAIGSTFTGTTFPWTTLMINVVGCFFLGVVMLVGPARWSPEFVTGVSVGFLGGFTTFSTFGYETQTLLRDDRSTTALLYVGLSVVLGIAAAFAGHAAGRALID